VEDRGLHFQPEHALEQAPSSIRLPGLRARMQQRVVRPKVRPGKEEEKPGLWMAFLMIVLNTGRKAIGDLIMQNTGRKRYR
jgi:hypothetical protein